MNRRGRGAALCLAGSLAACGGSGGSGGSGMGTTYPYATPQVNEQRTYADSFQDNNDNTINLTVTDTVSTVNADGTFVVQQESSEQNTVDGYTYGAPPLTVQDDSTGHETSESYTNSAGTAVTCTYSPHSTGPNYPLSVGQTWSLQYTASCNGDAPISYSQNGSVVDVESITVTAGTFTTLKLQSTVTWTDSNGTTHTQTITNWRDVKTLFSVKQTVSIAYSGAAPKTAGYPVSETIELQSGL